MSRPALLDVNVLIALFDECHVHHEPAHDWFADHQGQRWATCPLTENAFIRILSDPAGSAFSVATPPSIDPVSSRPHHEFWPDAISILDDAVFNLPVVRGPRQLTDVFLLGLAVTHGGRLVTFDQAIPFGAVNGATPESLEVIASAD